MTKPPSGEMQSTTADGGQCHAAGPPLLNLASSSELLQARHVLSVSAESRGSACAEAEPALAQPTLLMVPFDAHRDPLSPAGPRIHSGAMASSFVLPPRLGEPDTLTDQYGKRYEFIRRTARAVGLLVHQACVLEAVPR